MLVVEDFKILFCSVHQMKEVREVIFKHTYVFIYYNI